MPPAEQLTFKEALARCYEAGFRKKRLVLAVAVMSAESGRRPRARNVNVNGTIDRGLFQINDYWHPKLTDKQAYRVRPNIEYAFTLSKRGTDWTPWTTYRNGVHKKFVPIVRLVKSRGGWRKLVKP